MLKQCKKYGKSVGSLASVLNHCALTELRVTFLVVSSDSSTHEHCISVRRYRTNMLTLFMSSKSNGMGLIHFVWVLVCLSSTRGLHPWFGASLVVWWCKVKCRYTELTRLGSIAFFHPQYLQSKWVHTFFFFFKFFSQS